MSFTQMAAASFRVTTQNILFRNNASGPSTTAYQWTNLVFT